MKYIDYKNMKDFYTTAEVCRLFEMDMETLRHYSEKYQITPQEDQYGNWGFRKQMVRKLHNFIYKEQKEQNNGCENDHWAGTNDHKRGPWDAGAEERRRGPWD
ncbi:hypothetical protein [Candidatus Agathobaculum pullicola]|uniref:hypothetical protein n=1 Tax=Candidatus Agathobaculum pullicola TaxID=2838426 RepID=UPI003F9046C1